MKRFFPLFLLLAVVGTPTIYYGWNAPSSFREEQQKGIQQLQKEKDVEEDEDLEEEEMELPGKEIHQKEFGDKWPSLRFHRESLNAEKMTKSCLL